MNKKELTQRLDTLESEAAVLRKILLGKTGTVIERVKTFEDVCEELGIDTDGALPYKEPKEGDLYSLSADKIATNAFVKVSLIAKALNEGWWPNWDDSNEYKYYPWFDMRDGSGSGFSGSAYHGSHSNTGVGSRLCFKSRELCEYAAKQFEEVYKQLFTL
jgi:hypothetical protein